MIIPPCIFCLSDDTHLTFDTEGGAVYVVSVMCKDCLGKGPRQTGPDLTEVRRLALSAYEQAYKNALAQAERKTR